MNTAEGLRRIAAAIRWIGYAIGAYIIYYFGFHSDSVEWIIVAIGIVVAGLAHLLGWVVKGFAEPPK